MTTDAEPPKALILDFGSHTIKAGRSGELGGSRPQLLGQLKELLPAVPSDLLQIVCSYDCVSGPALVIPSLVAVEGAAAPTAVAGINGWKVASPKWTAPQLDSMLVGERALHSRRLFPASDTSSGGAPLSLVYPRMNGVINDWNATQKLLDHVTSELKVSVSSGMVVVTEPTGNPARQREQMLQLLFEAGAPSVLLTTTSALVLYAYGLSTGLVLESGDGFTLSVPIIDGIALAGVPIQRSLTGGQTVTDRLIQLIHAQSDNPRIDSVAKREIVRSLKERYCYVASDFKAESALFQSDSERAAEESRSYRLPDGQSIQLSASDRFRAGEALFECEASSDDGSFGIHKMVQNSILKSELGSRRALYANIVLAGGNTQLSGFSERLSIEMNRLVPNARSTPVHIHALHNREYAQWLGASVFASMPVAGQLSILREEYDESGPAIASRGCAGAGMSRGVKDLKTLVDENRKALTFHESSDERNELIAKMAKLKKLSRADKDLIAQLQTKLDEQKKELSSRALTVLDIQKNVDRFAATLKDRMDEADALRAKNTTLLTELDASRAALRAKETAFVGVQQLLDDTQLRVRDQNERIASLKDELQADKTSHAERLRILHNDSEADKERLQVRLRVAAQEYERLSHDKVNEVELAVSGQQSQLTQKDTVIKQLTEALSEAKTAAAAAASDWEKKYKSLETAHSELKSTIHDHATSKNVLESTVNAHADAVARVHDQLLESEHRASEKEEQLLQMKQQFDESQTALSSTTAALAETRAQLRLASDTLTNLTHTQHATAETHKKILSSYEQQLTRVQSGTNDQLQQSAKAAAERDRHWKLTIDELTAAHELKIVALNAAHANELKEASTRLTRAQQHEAATAHDCDLKLTEQRARIAILTNEHDRLRAHIVATTRTEREVNSAVAKLLNTQSAMEGGLTCAACVELFKDPVTLFPCGHTTCKKCVVNAGSTKLKPSCPECKLVVDSQLPNKILSELEGKFIYSTQVLQQLRKDLNAASASATPLSPRSGLALGFAPSETAAAAASAAKTSGIVSPRRAGASNTAGTAAAVTGSEFPKPSAVAPFL